MRTIIVRDGGQWGLCDYGAECDGEEGPCDYGVKWELVELCDYGAEWNSNDEWGFLVFVLFCVVVSVF